MGLKFRKSVKMGPVRVNLSKSGVGYSVGGKGFRYTKKAGGGSRTTTSIPGTGISYSKDHPKAKTSNKKKSSAASASYSRPSNPSSGKGGCLKGFLWFLAICLVIGMIADYWKVLLALVVVSVAGYILFKVYRKKHAPAAISAESTPESLDRTGDVGELPAPSPAEVNSDLTAAFDNALNAIPKVDILTSSPAPRQLLKNLPPYNFSNITRSTRLDSIFPLVVLDVETTGLYPSKSEIIEVSAIKFGYGMVPESCFTTLCKPKKPIPQEATAINHITDDMVADAPEFCQIAPALTDYLAGCNVAGHNLDFDLRFIFAHGATLPAGKRFYDTLDLAHLTIPNSYIYNYKLDTICKYYRIHRNDAHRSLSDCFATAKIFSKLVFDKTSRQLEADPDALPIPTTE